MVGAAGIDIPDGDAGTVFAVASSLAQVSSDLRAAVGTARAAAGSLPSWQGQASHAFADRSDRYVRAGAGAVEASSRASSALTTYGQALETGIARGRALSDQAEDCVRRIATARRQACEAVASAQSAELRGAYCGLTLGADAGAAATAARARAEQAQAEARAAAAEAELQRLQSQARSVCAAVETARRTALAAVTGAADALGADGMLLFSLVKGSAIGVEVYDRTAEATNLLTRVDPALARSSLVLGAIAGLVQNGESMDGTDATLQTATTAGGEVVGGVAGGVACAAAVAATDGAAAPLCPVLIGGGSAAGGSAFERIGAEFRRIRHRGL